MRYIGRLSIYPEHMKVPFKILITKRKNLL